ncbi:MAG TPA: carboxylating nicotinate-nucleotide diphosphorylase, partial [Thermomicrobiales bacterium]|nr:carboxylating nicotinate-nucleotide diphosphorylase [Thermomicrobiales bacterium]
SQTRNLIALALAEDIGTGDLTAESVVPEMATASGTMLLKQPGVISGMEVVAAVFATVDPAIHWTPRATNGTHYPDRTPLGEVTGPARSILTAERTALNFLQRLSGIATATATYAAAVAGTSAVVVDTRKTTPGMRVLEKAAVRHGGGANHRMGLFDGVLIKDNHIAAMGGDAAIGQIVRQARSLVPHTVRIEIEVATLDQLALALQAGADIIMLDNMDPDTMREAVRITDGRAILEASGGITLATIGEIARTGVDLISVGALTHSSPSLDISLDLTIA